MQPKILSQSSLKEYCNSSFSLRECNSCNTCFGFSVVWFTNFALVFQQIWIYTKKKYETGTISLNQPRVVSDLRIQSSGLLGRLDMKVNSFENYVLKEYENYSTRKKQEALGNACLLPQLL